MTTMLAAPPLRMTRKQRDEIERIARSLIDEPDPPISEALTRAA